MSYHYYADHLKTQQNALLAIPISLGVVLLSLGYWTYVTGFQFKGKRQARVVKGQYPGGLYNLGNTCFVNGVLQALASLPRVTEYLEARVASHALHLEQLDKILEDSSLESPALEDLERRRFDQVPRVTTGLLDLLKHLNALEAYPAILNPKKVLGALEMTRGSRRLLGYDQQDAHELFQALTSSLVKEQEQQVGRHGIRVWPLFESLPAAKEIRDRNSAQILYNGIKVDKLPPPSDPKFVFRGVLASRLSCVKCGYKVCCTGTRRAFKSSYLQTRTDTDMARNI
jgi:hypothetical protein